MSRIDMIGDVHCALCNKQFALPMVLELVLLLHLQAARAAQFASYGSSNEQFTMASIMAMFGDEPEPGKCEFE